MKVRIVLFYFLLNALGVNGQFVPAEVIPSQEKTIINGRVYIIHTVQKGQTFFSICRAYNVSQEDVLRENPGVAPETLKEGSTLRMPVGSGIDDARNMTGRSSMSTGCAGARRSIQLQEGMT